MLYGWFSIYSKFDLLGSVKKQNPKILLLFYKLEFVLLAFVKRKVMEVHSSSRNSYLMIQDKLLCSGVEAQIYHRHKGKQIPNRKYQIQRKHIAKNAVNHRRQCCAADRRRLDKPKNCPSVFLWQCQHQGCIKNRIASTVCKGSKKSHNAQRDKLFRYVSKTNE